MKNILILVGEYKPFSSTNGNIADNIVQELKNQGYDIRVATRKNYRNLSKYECIDDIPIYRYNDWNLIMHNFCIEKIKNGKKYYNILLQIKRMIYYFCRTIRKSSLSKYYIKKIKKVIKNINFEKPIDCIIPVSAPHEEIFAAMNYKKENRNIILLPYQLDRFANGNSLYPNNFLKPVKLQNNKDLELELLKECNKLFVLPPIYEYYKENLVYKNYLNKVEITEHPMIKNMKNKKTHRNKKTTILYAGALDVNLRNPTYLFELFKSTELRNSNIELELYTFGNCQSIIDRYKNDLVDIIIDKGKVSHDLIIKAIQNADILLSIGNNSNTEVPSKLFEYLSFCKPIIHLYYSEKDAYIEYLKKYKYSICIKMDKYCISENAKKIKEFLRENLDIDINYNYIRKNFQECTPKYVAKKFIQEIEESKK